MFGPIAKMMMGGQPEEKDMREMGNYIEDIVLETKPYQLLIELLTNINDRLEKIEKRLDKD